MLVLFVINCYVYKRKQQYHVSRLYSVDIIWNLIWSNCYVYERNLQNHVGRLYSVDRIWSILWWIIKDFKSCNICINWCNHVSLIWMYNSKFSLNCFLFFLLFSNFYNINWKFVKSNTHINDIELHQSMHITWMSVIQIYVSSYSSSNIILVAERFASAVSAFWSHNKAYGPAFQKSGFLSFLQMNLLVFLRLLKIELTDELFYHSCRPFSKCRIFLLQLGL